MIYVISAANTEYVKVGLAKNPISRMRLLQTGIPWKLVLLASADWHDSEERRIHRLLGAYWVRGEWFLANPSIDSLIKHMLTGADSPKAWIESLNKPKRLAKVLTMAR